MANFLVKKNCPSKDSKKDTLVSYVEKSKNPDVGAWLEQEKSKERFESNIKSLSGMLFSKKLQDWKKVKEFVRENNCLGEEHWAAFSATGSHGSKIRGS